MNIFQKFASLFGAKYVLTKRTFRSFRIERVRTIDGLCFTESDGRWQALLKQHMASSIQEFYSALDSTGADPAWYPLSKTVLATYHMISKGEE